MGEKIQKYVDFRASMQNVTTEPTKKSSLCWDFSLLKSLFTQMNLDGKVASS